MATLDKREPAVYVSIEDASFISSTTEVGRTVFMVGLCNRGRHNRVVTVTSQEEFQDEFGAPDFHITSQSHYNMDMAMRYAGKGLYIRVVPDDATIANVSIKENSTSTTTIGAGTEFIFNQLPSTTKAPLKANYIGNQSGYNAALLAYNNAVKLAKTVMINDLTSYNSLSVGDWIYSHDGVDDYTDARQIISKSTDSTDLQGMPSTVVGILMLDEMYTGMFTSGNSKTSAAVKYIPYEVINETLGWETDLLTLDPTVRSQSENEEGRATVDPDVIYTFYVTGAGKYYNDIKIKGVRNTELEKMYTYENDITDLDGNVIHKSGDVKYKYLFMNIGVYKDSGKGYDTLLEGPWVVSLTRKTPDGMKIRDLATGSVLYIQEVINNRSNLIKCVAGIASQNLVLTDSETNNEISEKNRRRVMLLMSSATPTGTDNYVPTGNALLFANGNDGTTDGSPLYTAAGNLYQSEEIWGKIKLAYEGAMTSVDGTIEQLAESVYPYYEPDYVVSGGFPAWVQEGARAFAEYRQDVFHLADTGSFVTSYEDDLECRENDVPWNNWTSALYTQWRQITDAYTGQSLWVNPCYHAIERHLVVDGNYFIAEPVAGIEKGVISDSIELAYKCNHTERGDLQDAELNFIISEPDGKYILTQLTTWKRLSILKRIHAAKFVCYCRKMIPPLLKDILQRKATDYWVSQAKTRVDYFLSKFTKNASVERYQILDDYSVHVDFDDTASELNVYIGITPLRVIERINVYITVS